MKAIVVSPVGGRVPAVMSLGGGRRDLEAEEVAAYLSKLRNLLPDAPPGRKLSKLELIRRVIKYICELESTLEISTQQKKSETILQDHEEDEGVQRDVDDEELVEELDDQCGSLEDAQTHTRQQMDVEAEER